MSASARGVDFCICFSRFKHRQPLRFLGQNWVVVVRKLALNRSIVLKRGRFDILALLTNAQTAQVTSNDDGTTPGHTAFTAME